MSINSAIQYSVSAQSGETAYEWSITPGTSCSAGAGPTINNTNSNVSVSTSRFATINMGSCTGTYSIVCRAINSCGIAHVGQKFVTVFDSNSNPCNNRFVTTSYPNPIKDGLLTVSKIAPTNPCDDFIGNLKNNSIKNDVKIYDLYGNVVYKNSFNTDEFNVNVLYLKKGHYILNVSSYNIENLKEVIIVE